MACSIILARLAEWHDPFVTLKLSKSTDFMDAEPRVDFVPNIRRTRAYDVGRIRYWVELLLLGERVPPVQVDNECWDNMICPVPILVDGNHRMAAHMLVGSDRISAEYGGRLDVLSYLQGRRKKPPLG